MILSKEQVKEFEEASRPLIKWLNDNCDPHTKAIIDCGRAELLEGVCSIPIEDYIKD